LLSQQKSESPLMRAFGVTIVLRNAPCYQSIDFPVVTNGMDNDIGSLYGAPECKSISGFMKQ